MMQTDTDIRAVPAQARKEAQQARDEIYKQARGKSKNSDQ